MPRIFDFRMSQYLFLQKREIERKISSPFTGSEKLQI